MKCQLLTLRRWLLCKIVLGENVLKYKDKNNANAILYQWFLLKINFGNWSNQSFLYLPGWMCRRGKIKCQLKYQPHFKNDNLGVN